MKGRGRKPGALLLLVGTVAVSVLVQAPFASGGAQTSATKSVSIRDDSERRLQAQARQLLELSKGMEQLVDLRGVTLD